MATITRTKIGPADHGRRMEIEEFIDADFEEGHLYELARGVIEVSDVPGIHHGLIVRRLAWLFLKYDESHPGIMTYSAGGGESRIRLPGMQSDRHPGQVVYLDPIPPVDQPWTRWVPHLVVEVVREGGEERDYVEKAEEYLRVGVREYWILDPGERKFLVHTRAGDVWRVVVIAPGATYQTLFLPGLDVRPDDLFGPAVR